MEPFEFVLISLAVWRISHLFSKEDGPFNSIYLLRKKAGAGFFGSLLDCFYCVSIWVALPVGLGIDTTWGQKILYCFALSASACLLEQATTNKKNNNIDYHED